MRRVVLKFLIKPALAEQLDGMRCANRSIPAPKCISRAILVAAPAYPFRLLGVERDFRHFRFTSIQMLERWRIDVCD